MDYNYFMKIQVFRLGISGYQANDFTIRESEVLNHIDEVSYVHSASSLNFEDDIILITNTNVDFDKIADNILEKTILMIHPNSGHDGISSEFIGKAKFPIVTGNDIRSNAVSEYILSCLFHHFTPIPNNIVWDDKRIWKRKRIKDLKTLILGYGHIGKVLYQSLNPLIDDLVVYDPKILTNDLTPKLSNSFDLKLFKDVEVLILACELNEKSAGFINTEILDMLSSSALIVNPARGALIEQEDLETYLQNNPNSMAYIDVYKNEPFTFKDFKGVKNINKSSHIAGVFNNIDEEIIHFEKNIITDFLVNKENFKSKHQEHIL